MKGLFDAVKGGGFGDISKSLNDALGGKLDSVIKSAGGKGASMPSGGFGSVGGLLGSAAIGSVLGALFSGKKSKKIAKKVAKNAVLVGGTAAVGALAWKFYQQWSQSSPAQNNQFGDTPQQQQTPIQAAPESNVTDATALVLLEAMVFAARADGHIDEEEKAYIQNAVESLFPDQEMSATLSSFLEKPIDPISLAAKVNSADEAQDLYRLSCAAINIDSFMERSYLDGLAKALNIEEAQKNSLELEALAVRESMS